MTEKNVNVTKLVISPRKISSQFSEAQTTFHTIFNFWKFFCLLRTSKFFHLLISALSSTLHRTHAFRSRCENLIKSLTSRLSTEEEAKSISISYDQYFILWWLFSHNLLFFHRSLVEDGRKKSFRFFAFFNDSNLVGWKKKMWMCKLCKTITN